MEFDSFRGCWRNRGFVIIVNKMALFSSYLLTALYLLITQQIGQLQLNFEWSLELGRWNKITIVKVAMQTFLKIIE